MASANTDNIDWSLLTAEMAPLCQEWQANLRATSPLDREAVRSTVDNLYRLIGKEPPVILWCDSPWQVGAMKAALQSKVSQELITRTEERRFAPTESNFLSLWNQMWKRINEQIDPARRAFLVSFDDQSEAERREIHKNWMFKLPWVSFLEERLPLNGRAENLILQLGRQTGKELRALCHLHMAADARYLSLENAYRMALGSRTEGLVSRQIQTDAVQISMQVFPITESFRLGEMFRAESLLSMGIETLKGNLQSEIDKLWSPDERKIFEFVCSTSAALAFSLTQDFGSVGLFPFYQCLCQHVPDFPVGPANRRRLQLFCELASYSRAYAFMDRAVFVSERPILHEEDQAGRLHSENGPAIVYGDGYKLYSWHGTTVPKKVIDHPEALTVVEILGEWNVEVRRVMIDRFGPAKFVEASGAQKLHEDNYGVLYRKELTNDEPLVMVKVINTTPEPDGSHKTYFLRVPPSVSTAREAVAWTFDCKADEYHPAQET